MRRGWNGISISRDTIHLPGMKMGYAKPCLFDRHAVGGEYGAAYKTVGPGTATLTFKPEGAEVHFSIFFQVTSVSYIQVYKHLL
jgi:isocitrate dehydrogenase